MASPARGPAFQTSGPDVVLGGGGFADDAAPPGALVQLGVDAPLAPLCRRPGPERTGPGSQQHGPPFAPGRRPRGRLGPHAADDLGRAGLRRAGRQLVPSRPVPRVDAGQRWCVRREGPEPGALPRPCAGRRDRGTRPRPVAAGGRRAARAQAARQWLWRCAPTAPAWWRVGRTRGCGRPGAMAARVQARCPGVEVGEVDVTRPPRVARPARRRRWSRGARRAPRSRPGASPRGAVLRTSRCPVRAVPASSSRSGTVRVAA